MFRIGEFALIAQVSGRLLRYYDRLGLLHPALTDEETGYRYYSAKQLPRLNRILALKELGLSLDQIAKMIDDDISPQEMRGMLMMKKAQVEQTLAEEQTRLQQIESRISQIDDAGGLTDYDVVVKSVPALPYLSVRQLCADMEEAVALLQNVVKAVTSEMRGGWENLIVQAHTDFDGDEMDIDAGFSLAKPTNRKIGLPGGAVMAMSQLPAAGEMATVVRSGPNYQAHQAFGSLSTWLEANNYRLDGLCREMFLELPFADPSQPDPVIEIQFPVRRV